ncbi:MAG: hypothetical protein ABJO02_12555 [Reichenbachiella sp.]|uniref:hypothetical protein n=1 Tax=Reichenbachiella sp. TaxID=2184521 RepID=UPI003297F914
MKENKKVVKPGSRKPTTPGTVSPKGEYFLIDNPDPAHLVQRVEIHGDSINVIDNISIEEAKRIFEEGLKKTEEPEMVELKQKAQMEEYEPTDTELDKFLEWLAMPNVFLDEGHLQKMYDYPGLFASRIRETKNTNP